MTINTMRTGALYIRVSTDKQEELSPDAQKRLGIEYAKKNGIILPKEYIFMETGISGRKADKRPKFLRMISMAKSKDHPVDVILVWKFSRFARNQEESIVYKSLLKKNNVDVVSISEPIIDGPFGTLIERIIEWMDEYYSIRLSEDVKRGMTEKAMRGGYQTYAPFGYTLVDGELCPNEDQAEIVRGIYDRYLSEGKSFFAIAKDLNAMGVLTIRGNQFERRTVKYIIQNPVYKGYTRWNPEGRIDIREKVGSSEGSIIEKGNHKPIISEADWDRANQKCLSTYTPRHAKPVMKSSHWLIGVLRCSNCNNTLASGGSRGGFQCTSYAKGRCTVSHYVSYPKIEKSVVDALKELSASGNFDYEIIQAKPVTEIKLIEDSLNKIKSKEDRIKAAYMNGIDTMEEYKENKRRIQEERENLEALLRKSEKTEKTEKTKQIMVERLRTVCTVLESGDTNPNKNTAIRSIVQHIVYTKRTEHLDIYLYC